MTDWLIELNERVIVPILRSGAVFNQAILQSLKSVNPQTPHPKEQ